MQDENSMIQKDEIASTNSGYIRHQTWQTRSLHNHAETNEFIGHQQSFSRIDR